MATLAVFRIRIAESDPFSMTFWIQVLIRKTNPDPGNKKQCQNLQKSIMRFEDTHIFTVKWLLFSSNCSFQYTIFKQHFRQDKKESLIRIYN